MTEIEVRDPETTTPYDIIKRGIFETPMEFYTVYVDADMARDLLMYNKEPKLGQAGTNRKASKVRVETYAEEIIGDRWGLSPQPIIFSDGGPVIQLDGQQRLKALLLASQSKPGVSVPFTICINAPMTSQSIMDLGKPRTPADYMRMYGHRDPVVLSASVRMLHCVREVPFLSVQFWSSQKLSPQVEREYLENHAPLAQGVAIAKDTKMLVIPRVAAVVWYLMQDEYGPFVASQFLNGLEKGQNMNGTDARYKLRELLSRRRIEKYSWDGFEQLGTILTGVSAFLLDAGERYNPQKAFSKTSKKFPELIPVTDLPDDVKARFAADLPQKAFQ